MTRDWKIFFWALMHSPQRCEIEMIFVQLSFQRYGYKDEIFDFNLTLHLPPTIIVHIPWETRRAYQIAVEGAELEIDEVPF